MSLKDFNKANEYYFIKQLYIFDMSNLMEDNKELHYFTKLNFNIVHEENINVLSYIHKSINFIYQIKKKQRITYVSRDQSAEFHKRIYF